MYHSLLNKQLKVSSSSPRNPTSLFSSNSKPTTSTNHSLIFQHYKKNFQRPQPSTRWTQKQQCRVKRNQILITPSNITLSNRKNKAVSCWLGHKWASYTMDKEILRSVFGLSLEYSDKKLPHYHKGMEMRFPLTKKCFRSMKLRIFCEKVLQKNHKVKRVNSYLQFFLGQNLKISLE